MFQLVGLVELKKQEYAISKKRADKFQKYEQK